MTGTQEEKTKQTFKPPLGRLPGEGIQCMACFQGRRLKNPNSKRGWGQGWKALINMNSLDCTRRGMLDLTFSQCLKKEGIRKVPCLLNLPK